MTLSHGLTITDLYETDGILRVDSLFLESLAQEDADLKERLCAARTAARRDAASPLEDAQLYDDLGPHLERFILRLFGVPEAKSDLQEDLGFFFEVKRNFVRRTAQKTYKADEARSFDGPALWREICEAAGDAQMDEIAFARHITIWEADRETHGEILETAAKYAAWAVHTRAPHATPLFEIPQNIDPANLVEGETVNEGGVRRLCGTAAHQRKRDGFSLTDSGMDALSALDQSDYCIICHPRNRDSCAKGLYDRKTKELTKNASGVPLLGCPLEEKISEMHGLLNEGWPLAALAVAMVDNPMIAGTGHRICNDCMKACIYQAQEPVNIPQVETKILKSVLDLPWGVEIYSLLSRWNPFNFSRPTPKPDSGYAVLVVGLGPAGYTLAHHLMNEGHRVVAIDGLKIEPLAPALSGIDREGERVAFDPIRDKSDLWESLDDRLMAGFGGVAEYGITVRWDKNFLKIIRLLLERRRQFSMFGGVRFGGTLSAEDAFAMGFDHIALCAGAGKPTVLNIPGGLARGVRQASDFLMALQLTGAAKRDSLANLQIRLPAVVIGGGLTAIDTATEALAYYVRQVEKFAYRYDRLVEEQGEAAVRDLWTPEETEIADEFLAHARALAGERSLAQKEGREPDFIPLLRSWGGATIAYRRRLVDSPAYRLNHEEIQKALEEGVRIAELLGPIAVELDEHGAAVAIRLSHMEMRDGRPCATGEESLMPARSVLVAAGTQPNTTLAREYPGFAELDGKYYRAYNLEGDPVVPEESSKPERADILLAPRDDKRRISFLGDQHPSFAGNVVKAMASARAAYPVINRLLMEQPPGARGDGLPSKLNHDLRAKVQEVVRLTPTIVEVIIEAPAAARHFKPGQFFRLQNYEAYAPVHGETPMTMEGLALTGAWVDTEKGLVSVIVLEMGGSSNLCRLLKPGEPVVLMGPTGAPTETPGGETVLLAGGGLGNAVLFSVGQALRAAGSRVLYFAAYKGMDDRYHVDNIERAADTVVWCCDAAPGFTPTRPQDKSFVGNVVEAIAAYGRGDLGAATLDLKEVDRILAIGSDRMMNAVREARHTSLKPYLREGHIALGSINSPMQCMMKEICAQCLQPHRNPETGETSVVFSCFNQDQALDWVDFSGLQARLCQNAVQEKLTRQWIARCLAEQRDDVGAAATVARSLTSA